MIDHLPATTQQTLARQVAQHPYPLLFASISGAHLYGFPSPDSDFDLRGVHLLPLQKLLGLQTGPETIEHSGVHDGLEIDLVTHDAGKFFAMLLRKNGYVLEQVLSPWIVHATPAHAQLVALARRCVTRHHAYHYLGFARTQWKLFASEQPPRVKPLLYLYRVLLTGLWLLRTGEVEANLVQLNQSAKLPYLDELMERKRTGTEQERLLESGELAFHHAEYERLRAELEAAHEQSHLPEVADTAAELHALLLAVRLPAR
jgi:uncharacterized protein